MESTDLRPLKAIQYSEFDINRGAYVYYETETTNFSESKGFQWIRNFVCPEPNLKDKLIVLTNDDQKLVGCPVIIADEVKYKLNRNEFRFNACFIVPADADALKYEVAVRKLAKYLRTLELDSCFLTNDRLKQDYLKPALDQIVKQINENGQQCSVKMYSSIFVNLKLLEQVPDPPEVASTDVPMFCNNVDLNDLENMDQMTQQVIASIDGLRHVQKIAQDTDTELDLVKAAMQNLIYHNVIKLVPIFSYKNRYIVTPKIQELYNQTELQKELIFFVVRNRGKDCDTFYECFRMLCAFDHGSLVKDVVNRMKPNNVDEKKLVQYCVLKGYLRRVRDFRISLDDPTPATLSNGTDDKTDVTKTKMKKSLRELCDGNKDSDSLACMGYFFNPRTLPSASRKSMQPTLPSSTLDSYITLWK